MKRWLSHLSEKTARCLTLGMLALAALLLGAALWLNLAPGGQGTTLTTYAMGSVVQQTVYGKNREEAAQAAASAVSQLEGLLSWRVEGSDIDRLNQAAGGDYLSIDPQTWDVLATCLQVSELSGGAFDATIAPLSRLWNFDEDPRLPSPEAIASFLPAVGFRQLTLLEDGTAALRSSTAALDLGAVGKGAACDAAVDAYRQAGAERAVVAVGGSVGLYGEKPGNEPWRVALRNPETQGSLGELALEGGFVSTSGSYEKCFEEDGVTYHHLLDPRTGYPAESGLLSVTVWSDSGALSDALSTACFVLGMEESLPLLEEFGSQAVFITQDHTLYLTQGMEGRFTLTGEGYTLGGTL